MRTSERTEIWVVYRMNCQGKPLGVSAVCEQREWDAMERAHPGQHILLHANITNEGEAERLARGTAGDPAPRPLYRPRRP
jgi:hypothetical protein